MEAGTSRLPRRMRGPGIETRDPREQRFLEYATPKLRSDHLKVFRRSTDYDDEQRAAEAQPQAQEE